MLAFQLEVVEKDDVVITADVDAFITSDHIMDPVTLVNWLLLIYIPYWESLHQGNTCADRENDVKVV